MTTIIAESCWIILPQPIENLSLDQVHIWSDFSQQQDIKISSNNKNPKNFVHIEQLSHQKVQVWLYNILIWKLQIRVCRV